MATSSSSCSPSSSAVTIPIPGRSILKRPPPTQNSIFSRFIKILPTQNQSQNNDDDQPLKMAHFILPQIATVYPISSLNPPSTPTLKEEKRAIEDREAERRRRIVRGNSISVVGTEEWWSLDKVESFYRECCASREEEPDPAISAALKHAAGIHPRSVDLSGVQLTDVSAAILSDVLTIEWGLRKLVLRECNLDEHLLKPMLHALLIPGTLSFLSVASNKRLKAPAFRIIGAYVSRAKNLQFLDLSQNVLDKKSIEYIVATLATAPNPGLVSLRLDDCSIRPAALEALSHAVRTSSLRNISLRHNRINATGAVALALLIKDYPDVVPAPPNNTSSLSSSPSSSFSSLPLTSSTPSPQNSLPPSPSVSHPVRVGPVLPPPRHPATAGPQTTYTPYIPRSRRGLPPAPNPLSPSGQPIPIITSSSQGGVTTRHPITSLATHDSAGTHSSVARFDHGPSAALLDKVRALDALPRLGALRTLDLRGNDLRNGITYIAQVLKRNRTLKVLNLSENKLDVSCLVTVAEALKYNSSLETLDLSKNPCSGPGLEGIQSLRTAFTLNSALKRLFLSSTHMTSAGAIALAEFLPESTSLLHLDLTMNNLDIAGVMALSSGLKSNHVMRCLDLNIPPGDEEFSRMCRDILNSCVRNTEEAEKNSQSPTSGNSAESGRGIGKGIWGMIEDSELAKTIRQGDGNKIEPELIVRARMCVSQLEEFLLQSSNTSSTSSPLSTPTIREPDPELMKGAKAILHELSAQIQTTSEPALMESLLGVNDNLMALVADISSAPERRQLKLHGLGLKLDNLSHVTENGIIGKRKDPSPLRNGDSRALFDSPIEERPYKEEDTPTTPRIDKGKGRAEPEPEEPEKVLSPTLLVNESEDEDDAGHHFPVDEAMSITSPNDRSRSWVAEEGEVFRKGNVLLGPEEMEGEYAGEDLRKELLEAMVERPPPRPIVDELGEIGSPTQEQRAPSPNVEEVKKPPPRPYVSRSRSSSSLLSLSAQPVVSPTLANSREDSNLSPATTLSPSSPLIPGGRSYPIRSRSSSSLEDGQP